MIKKILRLILGKKYEDRLSDSIYNEVLSNLGEEIKAIDAMKGSISEEEYKRLIEITREEAIEKLNDRLKGHTINGDLYHYMWQNITGNIHIMATYRRRIRIHP
jgi:hypothetical protein